MPCVLKFATKEGLVVPKLIKLETVLNISIMEIIFINCFPLSRKLIINLTFFGFKKTF